MIADVLSDALVSIRKYQQDLPGRYVGEEYQDLERVKAEMEVLRHKMDSTTCVESGERILDFRFQICFGFRHSDFGLFNVHRLACCRILRVRTGLA